MASTLIIRMALMLVCCPIVARSAPTIADGKRMVKNFLNQKCQSNNPMGCIDIAAAELSESEQKTHPIWEVYKLALRQIVDAKNIVENPNCSGDEYWDLLTLDSYTTASYIRGITSDDSLSPLDSLIHLVSLKRAEKCRDVYVQKFNELYSSVDSRSREIVEGFKHRELVEVQATMSRVEYMEWLIDYRFDDEDEQNLVEAVNYVKRLSSGHPNRNSPTLMFNEYLSIPCREYNEFLELKLASQMRFDAEMFEGNTFYHLEEDQADTLVPLYQCMARTHFCTVFEGDADFAGRFVSEWINRSREQIGQLPHAAAAA